MKNSQLAEVLGSLTKAEFRELGKFVRSPFHNNRDEVIRFYDALKKFYPGFKSSGFTQAKIFSAVYPKKKYSDVLMRKLVSLMTNLVMDFYAVTSFRENTLDYNIKLIYTLYGKNLPAMFERKAKSMEELLRKSKHTLEYYEAKFKYTGWVTSYLVNKNESANMRKYQNELDDFIEYFLIVALMQYRRLRTNSKMYNIKYDLKFYNEVIEFIKKYDYRDSTLVSLYYNLAMLTDTEEEKYFLEMQKFWKKFEDKLTDLIQYVIYVSLYNYCINRKQKGEIKYHKLQFDIAKRYFGKNVFPKELGYIQPNLFAAAIQNAAKLKEFKWAADFINIYEKSLDPETAGETINYCLAIIEFEKGSYEKSLTYLSTINPERQARKLSVKNLLIRIYYELDYTEELISLIDSYKHYLHRDKDVTELAKENNLVFIKSVFSLVKIKLNKNIEAALLLKTEIEAVPYFNLKEWVLEKIENLLNVI